MTRLSRKLDELSRALLDLDTEAMLIEELDGFIAGLIVCPEMIPPSAWLPWVWRGEGDEDEPVFKDLAHVNRLMGLVMAHYNDVAITLLERPERYTPMFPVDPRHNEVLWELWIQGFEKAVTLKPAVWSALITAETEAARAWAGLMMLADVARRDARFSDEQLNAITATAHDRIADWVRELSGWRLTNCTPAEGFGTVPNLLSPATMKVGRNNLCPCGSGKKYKKCCGLN
jgi:uncharacterized protein